MLNAEKLLVSARILSAEELGQLFRDAAADWSRGNAAAFEVMPWVDGLVLRQEQIRPNRHIPDKVRAEVLAVGFCAFCGSVERLSVDHIRPVSKKGGNERANLQCLCMPCNLAKSAKWEDKA